MATPIQAATINTVTKSTIWGALIQTCQFAHFRIPNIPYISMNERLEILKDAPRPSNVWPWFQYWVVGDKGHINRVDSADSGSYIDEAEHSAGDAAPFNPVPFVMRRDGQDLTEAERRNYALRRYEEHDGINYWCYYAKRIIGMTEVTPVVYHTQVVDGVEDTKEYKTSNGNLFPLQQVVTPDQSLTTDSDVLTVSAPWDIQFTAKDAQEMMNVARILYRGNEKRSIVSEIGLCTGIDSDIQTESDGGSPITFKDAISVWVAAWISTYQQMSFNNNGFTISLELGATEPMRSGTEIPDNQAVSANSVSRTNRLSATITMNP